MTKVFKRFLVIIAVLALTLTLTGCGFASKAQKLDEDFKAGETMTLEDIKDKMGDPTSEAIVEVLGVKNGAVVWIEGCKNLEEAKEKWDAGETSAALVVTVVANKITSVDFIEEYKGEK